MYLDGEKDCMKSLNIFITDPLSGVDRLTFPVLKVFVFPDRYTEQYYADSFSDFLKVVFFLA